MVFERQHRMRVSLARQLADGRYFVASFPHSIALLANTRLAAQCAGVSVAVPITATDSLRRMILLAALIGSLVGCGTTRDKLATEQLLLSDAVDRSVARIDFSPLKDKTVFLNTQYLTQMKVPTVVNADYVISSLRQQMVLAGCLLQDERSTAEFIAEPRVGVLGTDGYDVNYGIPQSQGMSAAASAVSGSLLPPLPEISLGRKSDDSAAAKIAVFAYRRETKEPVWQSGTSVAKSTAKGWWILGVGPFRNGTIYEESGIGQERLSSTLLPGATPDPLTPEDDAFRKPAILARDLQDRVLGNSVPAELLARRPKYEMSESSETEEGEPATEQPDADK